MLRIKKSSVDYIEIVKYSYFLDPIYYTISKDCFNPLNNFIENQESDFDFVLINDINKEIYNYKNTDFWISFFKWCEENKEDIRYYHNLSSVLFSSIGSPNNKFFKSVMKDYEVRNNFLSYIRHNKMSVNTNLKKFFFIKKNKGLVNLDMMGAALQRKILYDNEKSTIRNIPKLVIELMNNYPEDFMFIDKHYNIYSCLINNKRNNYKDNEIELEKYYIQVYNKINKKPNLVL